MPKIKKFSVILVFSLITSFFGSLTVLANTINTPEIQKVNDTKSVTSHQGPNYAGLGTTAGAGVEWDNPYSVTVPNGHIETTATLSHNQRTQQLRATNFNFNIPTNAKIKGISVSIAKVSSASDTDSNNLVRDKVVKLIKSGNIVGTNKALTNLNWWTYGQTGELVQTYGGEIDKWGKNWTPEDINSPEFGVALSAYNSSHLTARTATVLYMEITIYYTDSNANIITPIIDTSRVLLKSE